ARFEREARVASRLRHPNAVEIFDFGQGDDTLFLAMELLEGESLRAVLEVQTEVMPLQRALRIAAQVADALVAAHREPLIHRDIKPENIFLISRTGSDHFVKVFDFGIAKVFRGGDGQPVRSLTIKGQLIGTPPYMSPEQCLGEDVDARSDLYTVGVIAYELLTGHTPFECDNPAKLLRMHVKDPPPAMIDVAPDRPVDPSVEAIIRRALAKDRDERYSSANELAKALLRETPPSTSTLMPGLRSHFGP
ncbi:MAG: serine/threonine protein kinase, partial [Myxococcales bacterium]|nr:serine/threonine protein kinase [Myxococcales bacterium]